MPKTKALAILVAVIVAAGLGFFYRDRLLVFIFGKPSPQELQLKIDEIQNFAVKQRNYESALQGAEKLTRLSPDFAEGWHWKGISEFELGRYEEAKISFEKVLALEPSHKAATNYLKILTTSQNNGKNNLNRESFESELGFIIDPVLLTLDYALSLLPNSQQQKVIAAKYSTTQSLSQSNDYFKTVLQSNGFEITEEDTKDKTIISGTKSSATISLNIGGEPLVIYVFFVVSK